MNCRQGLVNIKLPRQNCKGSDEIILEIYRENTKCSIGGCNTYVQSNGKCRRHDGGTECNVGGCNKYI